MIVAIDPGTESSAWVVYRAGANKVEAFGLEKNEVVRGRMDKGYFCWVKDAPGKPDGAFADRLVIEMIKGYGNAMGDEILKTCFWIGRFVERWDDQHVLIPRKTVVTTLCMNPRANDANVRQAIIDRYGGKLLAIGKKAAPGPLYGVTGDVWSALAVALAWVEIYLFEQKTKQRERVDASFPN